MDEITFVRSFGILYRTFLSYISSSLDSMDLSFSDCIFLMNIGEQEGISADEISKALAIDKAAITRSVKKMEEKEYIFTSKSTRDKRVKHLYLTETGKQFFHYMTSIHSEWLKHVLRDLDSDQIADLSKNLDLISKRAKDIKKILS